MHRTDRHNPPDTKAVRDWVTRAGTKTPPTAAAQIDAIMRGIQAPAAEPEIEIDADDLVRFVAGIPATVRNVFATAGR